MLARIISVFSERVDLLMEDAAAKLNLKSLLLLIEELCQLCHVQLNHLGEDNIRYDSCSYIKVFLTNACVWNSVCSATGSCIVLVK